MSRYINVAGIILAVLNAVLANERTYLVFLASATWAALLEAAPRRFGDSLVLGHRTGEVATERISATSAANPT